MPKPAEQIVLEMAWELHVRASRELPRAIPGGASASDVAQDTITAALIAIANGRMQNLGEEEIKNYMLGIFRYELANALRSAYRWKNLKNKLATALRSAFRNPSVAVSGNQVPDPGRTPSSVAVLKEQSKKQSDRLNRALGKLSERNRNILTWKREEKLTFKQIGEKLGGRSPQAAKQAFARAYVEFEKYYYGPQTGLA
jgi:RNA polymerase sigma factor (sigma-70 family)